ncbi:hypothetical protein KAR91_71370 [Candidatus Pacearchaeota archaeon]|nr:hypothetical protein [Candidatus Pacearchaeota archaeon]
MTKLSVENIAKDLDKRIKRRPPKAASSDEISIAFLLAEIRNLNKNIKWQARTRYARKTSKRGFNFLMFAFEVLDHIEEYTIPQYGDEGEDRVSDWTVEDCLKAVKKYIARYGRNTRKGQQMLDFKKMLHFVQLAAENHNRLAQQEGVPSD